jgi:PhzF family phenazine biosynthesis protein
MTALTAETGAAGLAVYGPHDGDGPATFELRCICYGAETCEDPVTGSANAALACLLTAQDRRPGLSYTVRQGTVLGRDGQISVAYDDPPSDAAPGANSGRIWIGGHSVTVVAGHFRCA